jgi:hypothetical protein
LEPLFLALLGHLVGDYLFQTDWMAENKKSQSLPCFIHSVVWAGCVILFTGWGWIPFIFLTVIHFIQDRTYIVRNWMRLIGQDHFATGLYAPWSIVIVDNTFHLLQIWLVWKFAV